MANTQTLSLLLVFYFITLTVIIGALSPVLADSSVTVTGNPAINTQVDTTTNTTVVNDGDWSIGSAISNVVGFFTFDMVLGVGAFEWIIKIFFVWFPLFALVLMAYFSIRGV